MTDWTGTNSGELTPALTKLSDDFENFMISTITIYPFLSKDKYGQPSYSTGNSINAIVIAVLNQNVDKDNQNAVSMTKIFIDGNVEITEQDKILIDGKTPTIKKIIELPDENGVYAKMVLV